MKTLVLSTLMLLAHVCSADIVRTYTGTSTSVWNGTSWELTETCTWKSVITPTVTNKITVGVQSAPGSTVGPIATLTDVNGAPIFAQGVVVVLEPSAGVTEQLHARYGVISPQHVWHGFTTNVPLTGSGPPGSQVVFKLKFEWPSAMNFQGAIFFSDDGPGAEADFGLIPPLYMNPTTYKGLRHCPAGAAALAVTPGGPLHVSNIGSSGQDGVAIELPGVSHWEARWAPLDPTDSLPVGAFVRSAIFGSAGTVTNSLLGSWRLIKLGSNDYGVTANFDPMGAATVTAQIYDGDTRVTEFPGLTGQFVRVNGCVDDDHWGNPTPSGPFGLPGKFGGALTFLAPRQFTFSNGSSATGTRLVILPDGAPPVSSLSKAMVVAKDIPNIEIDYERHFQRFSGIENGSLGQANLRVGASLLTVSNLGSSGQDGVSVSLRDTEAFTTEIPLEPGLPVGGYMVSNFTGPDTLGTMVPLGKVGMRRLADSMAAIVDFSDVGSPTYTATVYRAGVPVLTGSGLSGEVVQLTASGGIECTCGDFSLWPLKYSWTWRIPLPSPGGSSAAFTIPGVGTNVPGDEIVFTPDVGITTQIRPTRVDIVGAEMPIFQFSGMAIRKFGIDHAGAGVATLHPTAAGLLVDNLGSSGQDGVEIKLAPPLRGVAVHYTNPDPSNQLPVGAAMRLRSLGVGSGLSWTKTGPQNYRVDADFSTQGAPSWTVEVYDGANLVSSQAGQTDPIIASMFRPIVEISAHYNEKTKCTEWDIKIDLRDVFNLSSGASVMGDKIVVRPDGGLPSPESDTVMVSTTAIPSINIIRAEKTVSYGGLAHTSIGQANLDIVSTTTADWYRCPGLSVSNLGSSGQDGVSIKLPANQSFTTQTFADPAAPLGSLMKSMTFAGGASTPIEVVGMQRVGTGFGAIVDFSGLGSPTYTAKVFNKGIYIGGAGGLTDGDVTFSFSRGISITCVRDDKTKCWTWTIHFPDLFETAAFSIPGAGGGGPLLGDEILFIPDQAPLSALSATRIDMLSNMPEITILDESLRLSGLEHRGLGAANLEVAGSTGALQLWNLGSSGQDGVSLRFGEADYATVGLQPGNATTQVDGSFVEMTALARFNGVENSPMVIGRVEDVGDQYALSARYLPGLQGSGLRVDLFNGQTLVGTQNLVLPPSGSTGTLATFADRPWQFDWIWWLVDTLGSMQSIVSSDVPGPVALAGHAPVVADRIVISLLQPTGTFSHLSDVEIRSTGLSGMSVFDPELGMFHHPHRAVGAASILAADGKLIVGNLGNSGQDGVRVQVGNAASADYRIDTFTLAGGPLKNIRADYEGSVGGLPNQPLGHAAVTPLTDGSDDYELAADLSALGSPTLRIEVWDGDTLVVALPGVAGGIFGRASRFPNGGGKTGRRFGDWVLGCISWDYPLLTNFTIQGGQYGGTRLLMLQESQPTANYLSSYTLTAEGLSDRSPGQNGFILTDETSTPLPPPSGFAKVRFNCVYKLIPPTCTWTIVRSATTLPDAFAGVVYHLQEAVQVPTDYDNLQLVVSGSNGGAVPFELSPDVAAKAEALHPAPPGYIWVGFQSVETFSNNTSANLIADYSSRVTFRTADPANTAGASWFGSDAPAGSGHPSGEIYQLFVGGPPPDLDDDGLPDSWETTYGLNPDLAADVALDLDGDGKSNGQEYTAGTDPSNPASVLKLEITNGNPDDFHARFEAVAGKTYLVERSSGLLTWTTTAIIPPASVAHAVNLNLQKPASPPIRRMFYRVRCP